MYDGILFIQVDIGRIKKFSNEHGLLVVLDPRTDRVNKRSYYNAVKNTTTKNETNTVV